MAVLGVCLSLVAALQGSPAVFVPTASFTLAWTHSIEKIRWEEDYAVELDAQTQQPVLHATAARVQGSGAGMEPPADARLANGWYHYTPTQAYLQALRLTRSEFTPDYDLCLQGKCQPMSNFIASDTGMTWARACFEYAIMANMTTQK